MFAGSAEHITDFGTLKTGRVKMADPNCSRCAIEAEVRKQEREAFALECIDLVASHGGSVEIEAAIRDLGGANG